MNEQLLKTSGTYVLSPLENWGKPCAPPPPSRTSEGLGSAKSREGDNLVVPPTIATDSVEDSSLQPVFFSEWIAKCIVK